MTIQSRGEHLTETTTRRELLTNVAKALPLAAVAVAVGEQSAAAAPKGGNSATALITTAVPNVGTFVGTLTMSGAQVINGVLNAVGTVSGNMLAPDGTVLQTIANQAVTAPLQVTGSCTILNLVLGPLHLDVLGLVIDLNQVVLTITAVPGAGNLLGNLLCAVANLLNGGGGLSNLLQGVANLLNQILGAL
jgi:hypothetical protein